MSNVELDNVAPLPIDPVQRDFSVKYTVQTPEPMGQELLLRADKAIKANPHLSGHHVFCQEAEGIVVLHGRVSSFFQKQIAQETLKKLEGVEKVINELEVEWFHSTGSR